MSDLQQTASNELFYLKWSNFQMNVSSEFKKIQESSDLVDITFSCDGKLFGAHKLVLFACSPYFREILKKNPCSHPVFFINGVKGEVLRAILDFMYMGEVHINNEDLIDFIEMAEQFKIRGVTKENSDASLSNLRRTESNLQDKQRKHKKIRLDDLNDGTTTTDGGMIETKTEIEFGDQTSQAANTYGNANVDYGKSHQRMVYDDAGPSSVQAHDQWLDDKHFMAQHGPNSNNPTSNTSSNSDDGDGQQRCKSSKNYKALEPCSCPLCARVYSNVSNLRQHMRLIHNPTSVCCPLCQKSFTSDLYLKRHYLSMHGSSIPAQTVTNAQSNSSLQSTQPTSQQQQPQSQQSQTQQQQTHAVDPKHVNPSNAIPFHLYATPTKREYADLHTNTSQAATNPVSVDGKQTQMSQWGYDTNKVE